MLLTKIFDMLKFNSLRSAKSNLARNFMIDAHILIDNHNDFYGSSERVDFYQLNSKLNGALEDLRERSTHSWTKTAALSLNFDQDAAVIRIYDKKQLLAEITEQRPTPPPAPAPDPDAQTFVAYYRVSTQKQGRSGLGLEAQQEIVQQYARPRHGRIIAEFTEIESGKKSDRPQLAAAIEHANEHGATLLVAKLDRLARNVEFIFRLYNSETDFVAADLPDFNSLTLGVFASFAQYERERISKRTKDALAALKRRGAKLGNPNGWTSDAQEKATTAKRTNAKKNSNTRKAKDRIRELIELAQFKSQALTIDQVAGRMNDAGLRTTRGKKFTKFNVRYLLNQVLQEMQLKNLPK